MVLAMGSGEVNRAIALARKVNQGDKNNALATLFLIMDALARQDYEETHATLDTVPQ